MVYQMINSNDLSFYLKIHYPKFYFSYQHHLSKIYFFGLVHHYYQKMIDYLRHDHHHESPKIFFIFLTISFNLILVLQPYKIFYLYHNFLIVFQILSLNLTHRDYQIILVFFFYYFFSIYYLNLFSNQVNF
jgi:hypothetical protein